MQNWPTSYINPYGSMQQNAYPLNQMQNSFVNNVPIGDQLLRVNGIEGARAFATKPNSVVALFDANEDIMYIKTTDAANFPVIKCYGFAEIKENSSQDQKYVTETDLAKFKEEVLSDVKQFVQQRKYATNESNAKPKRSE